MRKNKAYLVGDFTKDLRFFHGSDLGLRREIREWNEECLGSDVVPKRNRFDTLQVVTSFQAELLAKYRGFLIHALVGRVSVKLHSIHLFNS